MTQVLRAFVVTSDDYAEHEGAALVYATTPAQARSLACPHIGMGVDYTETKARRTPEHDARATSLGKARVETDKEYLRTAGWCLESEQQCCGCGFYAMGLEKYGVCRLTGICKVCVCPPEPDDEGVMRECPHDEGFSWG